MTTPMPISDSVATGELLKMAGISNSLSELSNLQSLNSNANSISDCVATHCSPISNVDADADSIPNEISAPTPISDNVAIMAYNHV